MEFETQSVLTGFRAVGVDAISPVVLRVLGIVAVEQQDRGFATIRRIARRFGTANTNGIQGHMRRLVAFGLIERVVTGKANRRSTQHYRVKPGFVFTPTK